MGIRSATNIKLLKRGSAVAAANSAPAMAAPTSADRRRAIVATMGTLPSFDIPHWAAKKTGLSERLLDYFKKTKLFTDREWKSGVLANVLADPTPVLWDSNKRSGYDNRIPFEIYPKGRKKEGRITGFLRYGPNIAAGQVYPSGINVNLTELAYEDGAPERVKTSGQWTATEEAGWKKFLGAAGHEFTTAVTEYKAKHNCVNVWQLKSPQLKEVLAYMLARDFTGTDASEIRVEGRATRRCTVDLDAAGSYNGYHYDWTLRAYRVRRRGETEAEINIREVYTSGSNGIKYEVASITKVNQP